MLFYIIYLSISKKILDFSSRNDLQYLGVSMIREETYEISIPAGFGTFIYEIDTYYDLEVQAKNSDGNLVTYGTFNADDRLFGVVFQTKNYTLIFKNTGKFDCELSLYLKKNFSSLPESYLEFFHFKKTDTFDILDSPFIIFSARTRISSISLILLFSLLAFYLFLTCACKDKGKNYCKCCAKDK